MNIVEKKNSDKIKKLTRNLFMELMEFPDYKDFSDEQKKNMDMFCITMNLAFLKHACYLKKL